MKPMFSPALLVFPMILLAGCGAEKAAPKPAGAELVRLFEQGKGVRLPDETRLWLGVDTVEVAERRVARSFRWVAQVYRAAAHGRLAAALASVPAREAGSLAAGQSVLLKETDPGGKGVSGTLDRLDRQTEGALGQVDVLIEFPDEEGHFPAGSFLDAVFNVPAAGVVFAVPAPAVVRGPAGAVVYATHGDHFTRTPVKLGAAGDGWVEVIDGLYAGDFVVAQAVDAMWMIELYAVRGGNPCCPVFRKSGEP